jgi:hypothetical protein
MTECLQTEGFDVPEGMRQIRYPSLGDLMLYNLVEHADRSRRVA